MVNQSGVLTLYLRDMVHGCSSFDDLQQQRELYSQTRERRQAFDNRSMINTGTINLDALVDEEGQEPQESNVITDL